MLKIENTEVMGWEAAIRGMRNPMNSWERSDSGYSYAAPTNAIIDNKEVCAEGGKTIFAIGRNDFDLMTRLSNAGTAHRKFMRMVTVYADITAPLYW